MKTRYGITMIELLIALAGTVIIVATTATAFGVAIRTVPAIAAKRNSFQSELIAQQTIRELIRKAWIAPASANEPSYFTTDPATSLTTLSQLPNAEQQSAGGSSAGGQNSNSSSSTPATNDIGNSGSNTLVFTALGLPPAAAALRITQDQSSDPTSAFETANQSFGPSAGVTEVELSTNPVGDTTNNQTGLFLREQRPADMDPTSGGTEQLLIPNAKNLTFEFFDGTNWDATWNTTGMTPPRLPAAIRVTYTVGDSTTPTVFVVPLPNSDATTTNPVAVNSSTTGGVSQ